MSGRGRPNDNPSGRPMGSRLVDASRTLNARLARWLLIVVAVVGTLVALWVATNAVTASDAQVPVTPAVDATLTELVEADLPEGTTLHFERATGPLVLHLEDVALSSRLLATAAQLLWLGLGVGAAAALAGIAGENSSGRPFSSRVSRRLTVLIGLAAIGSFVPSAVANLASLVVMTDAGITPPDSVFGLNILDLSLAALLAVAVLASLDQAIRHGRNLTDDAEGLV